MKSKKGMEFEALAWLIIGIIVLITVIGGYLILNDKAEGALEFVKSIFRRRG